MRRQHIRSKQSPQFGDYIFFFNHNELVTGVRIKHDCGEFVTHGEEPRGGNDLCLKEQFRVVTLK